jgi:hypothetical protein
MTKITTKFLDFNNRHLRVLFFVASLIFAIFLQFRTQIFNRFSILYGDRYDAVIVATILEHWFNVLSGFSHWSELNYFFPYSNTLGQTDGYFIVGVIYSAFRYFGIDPFLSSEFANIAVKAIGFYAFFIACRKIFELPFWWSLVGASLFVLSNNATIHGQRLQLATIAFAPIVAILMWHSYKALYANNAKRFIIFGSAAGAFLGAWSITCFYMTWFFIFFTTFFFFILGLSLGSSRWNVLKEKFKSQKFSIIFVLVVTALSLLPLLSVYIPKSQESGMRPYESVANHTVPVEGILQVGTENFMFGKIYNVLLGVISPAYAPKGEYYNTGIAPILFFIFLAGCSFIFRNKGTENRRLLLRTFCIATLATWILLLDFSGYSAWYYVYHLFPGAKALNVVSAYQIFLTIPVIIICINYLSSISYKIPPAILILFVSLLCLEELNSGYISLNRENELKRVSLKNLPPQQCSSFFVTGWPDQMSATPVTDTTSNNYAHNVSAMLIAELIRLPTVNGIASINPPDWNFGYPNNADYIQRIKQYTEKHQVKSLCKLNLESHTWNTTW